MTRYVVDDETLPRMRDWWKVAKRVRLWLKDEGERVPDGAEVRFVSPEDLIRCCVCGAGPDDAHPSYCTHGPDRPSQPGLFGKEVYTVESCKRLELSVKVERVIQHYRSYHPMAKPGDKARKLIAKRLSHPEEWAVEDLCKAIDGNHRSPWHTGENPSGQRYHDLGLIFRDSDRVLAFVQAADAFSEGDRIAKTWGDKSLEDARARLEED